MNPAVVLGTLNRLGLAVPGVRRRGRATDWLDELDADHGENTAPGSGPGNGWAPRWSNPLRHVTPRHVAVGAGAFVVLWVALVIVGAVADASAATDRAGELRIENQEMAQRLERMRREAALVRSEPYIRLEARGFGVGRNGERAFSLQPGAPPPSDLPLLGADPKDVGGASPLEDWLDLLFGR